MSNSRDMDELFQTLTPSPVLSADDLRAIAVQALSMTEGDRGDIRVTHIAAGTARVARNRVRINESGDEINLSMSTAFGMRDSVRLSINQIDSASLRNAVAYLNRVAHEQPGFAEPIGFTRPPRQYLPVTSAIPATKAAFDGARHAVLPQLVEPLLDADLTAAAFAGVYVKSIAYANTLGCVASGQETDTELTVSGWSPDGFGNGWAGQADRDWTRLRSDMVASEALRLTRMAANPVAVEPGRRTAILSRDAVAQLVQTMGGEFDFGKASNNGPLHNYATNLPKLGEVVVDKRLKFQSDPNDVDGGYLPFDSEGFPLAPMSWIEDGVLTHLAFNPYTAAREDVKPSNSPPGSVRVSGGPSTIDEMISSCETGIYVNRVAQVSMVDGRSGAVTGVTTGGCFLVRHGKIERSIRNLRFVASPWFFFNQLQLIGVTARAAFGYAPWAGEWPIPPVIVPPIMVNDFNFVALADAV